MNYPEQLFRVWLTEPALGVWGWTEAHVNFALNPRYRAAISGRFDPQLMPFWREPMESVTDNTVKELFVVKPTQGGGSENCIVCPLRYMAATMNKAIMYVAAQQEKAEEFFIERIKLGMTVADTTKDLAADAEERGQVYNIGLAQIVLGWAAGKDTFKMRPFDVIYLDEVSSYKTIDLLDQARNRFKSRPFSKLIGISSPDPQQHRPSDEDPIWIEHDLGDCRKWHCTDPMTGNLFVFELKGVKWDQAAKVDDQWDLQRVKESAYYQTPDGTRIEEKDRNRIIAGGKWIATNPKGLPGKRSYWLNQIMLPYEAGEFGEIAKRFLESKRKGAESLRTFIYEVACEKWTENRTQPTKDVVSARSGGYERGQAISETEKYKTIYVQAAKERFLTADVQQASIWWAVREWMQPGHSGLIDYGYCITWDDLDKLGQKYKVRQIGIDIGYEVRRGEVETFCSNNNDVMMRGSGNIRQAVKWTWLPKYPGTYRQGTGDNGGRVALIDFNTDEMKNKLWAMIEHRQVEWNWNTFDFVGHEYLWQMQSEVCQDGHWEKRKSHSQNHLWDCEVMQIVLARSFGLLEDITVTIETTEGEKK